MKRYYLLLLLLLLLLCEACAPKIYGRRPHRRDRNCGCEYMKCDTIQTYETFAHL